MHRALLELTIQGVETSRDFHLRVMEDDEFRRGEIEIQWLERRLPSLLAVRAPADRVRLAAIAAALVAERDRVAPARPAIRSGVAPSAEGDGATTAWKRAARKDGLR
jgi:acetyl-CoA carboxylase biotin carboxylase subunit